jgi:hypothetical protein
MKENYFIRLKLITIQKNGLFFKRKDLIYFQELKQKTSLKIHQVEFQQD